MLVYVHLCMSGAHAMPRKAYLAKIVYTCVYICVCVYTCKYIHFCVCVCVYTCEYMYV